MTRHTADFWIRHLQLNKHIEGGWYSEVYRSALVFNKEHLPSAFEGERNACTHIYFLLDKNGFSAFHRIKSDELWHFYAGDPFIIYEIDENDRPPARAGTERDDPRLNGSVGRGKMKEHLLGNDIEKGQSLFHVIKAGNWFASKLADGGEYGLGRLYRCAGF